MVDFSAKTNMRRELGTKHNADCQARHCGLRTLLLFFFDEVMNSNTKSSRQQLLTCFTLFLLRPRIIQSSARYPPMRKSYVPSSVHAYETAMKSSHLRKSYLRETQCVAWPINVLLEGHMPSAVKSTCYILCAPLSVCAAYLLPTSIFFPSSYIL